MDGSKGGGTQCLYQMYALHATPTLHCLQTTDAGRHDPQDDNTNHDPPKRGLVPDNHAAL